MKNKNNIYLILKVLIILIPLIFLEYILYSNFLMTQNVENFYDIGSEKDNYLSPVGRISDKMTELGVNYRNITNNLVYFDIPIPEHSETVNVSVKFKDNFPENSEFSLGAKDQEDWHYTYNILYRPTIEKLMEKYPYEKQDDLMLFKLNEKAGNYSIHDFYTNPPSVNLATDQNIIIPDFKIPDYQPREFEIKTALRGSQIFYIYIKGNFELEVEKADLNWYEEDEKGEDTLTMNLYDLNKTLIASETIKDDGEEEKNPDKDNLDTQSKKLSVSNLKEGVYKLELKNNGDMLITNIKLNQDKIILSQPYFPAQSEAYFNDFEEKSKVYFKAIEPITLTAQTDHDYAADQTLKINNFELEIKKKSKEYSINLPAYDGFYELTSKKNDVRIKGPEFFSFSQDSWFDPFKGKNIELKQDIDYLEKNADYVLTRYNPVKDLGDGWKLAETSFEISDLYIKANNLNLLFNAPHLAENKPETNKLYIAIDWINATVHKPALLKIK